MPHQCTNCGHVFADGSKEMLSGCPDCGGNKFQYHPGDVAESEPADPPADADADAPEPPEPEGGSVAGAVGRAANKVRDAVTSDPDPAARTSAEDTDATDAATADDATTTDGADTASTANAADASARRRRRRRVWPSWRRRGGPRRGRGGRGTWERVRPHPTKAMRRRRPRPSPGRSPPGVALVVRSDD
ncbi:hypothetical protein LQ368_12355 [Halobacterium noricense]|uniref:OapC/ArvC family zinc-ribbon domain-containing protein n=1 Tax=Halobacterium noricense TaxID=223182 RepID=UPI001F3FAD0D|nr:Zn-ribbon containing protein [Halobacterium noricense]MCG1004224.1 hypothetical protein [Halobacterium noricense]